MHLINKQTHEKELYSVIDKVNKPEKGRFVGLSKYTHNPNGFIKLVQAVVVVVVKVLEKWLLITCTELLMH